MRKPAPAVSAAYFTALVAGILFQGLYALWPNALTAVLAPVDHSVWELSKLGFWPCVPAVLLMWTRRSCRAWRKNDLLLLLSAPVAMFAVACLLQFCFPAVSGTVYTLCWVALLSAFFYLFCVLEPIAGRLLPWLLLALLMGGLYILFTFFPPDSTLFLDQYAQLSG